MYASRCRCTPVGVGVRQQVQVYASTCRCTPVGVDVRQQVQMYASRCRCTPVRVGVRQYVQVYASTCRCTPVGVDVRQQVQVYASRCRCTPVLHIGPTVAKSSPSVFTLLTYTQGQLYININMHRYLINLFQLNYPPTYNILLYYKTLLHFLIYF